MAPLGKGPLRRALAWHHGPDELAVHGSLGRIPCMDGSHDGLPAAHGMAFNQLTARVCVAFKALHC